MGKSVVLVPMLATMLLFSQSEQANLTGSVADPSGAVIAGAEVKVTHLATNTTAAVRTTTAGLQRRTCCLANTVWRSRRSGSSASCRKTSR